MFGFFRRKSRAAVDATSIGNILLHLGFINRDQLDHAIDIKTKGTCEGLLGELLIAIGACTRVQLEGALSVQHASRNRKSSSAALLLDAARARTEALTGPLDELHAVAKRISAPIPNGHAR